MFGKMMMMPRILSLDGCFHMKEEFLRDTLSSSGSYVRVLNLNHCYWWSSRLLQWTLQKCLHLNELHLIECRLQIPQLVPVLSSQQNLTAFSFSVSSFTNLKKSIFTPCQKTLQNLIRLRIYYSLREPSMMSYLGEQDTLLDYCDDLEELVIGSAGMAVPELYRPVIGSPLSKLKVMAITNNVHAGALMLFYGTLSQLPNSILHWKTLLMPNVNFIEFIKKDEFKGCLKNIESLVSLDVSGSKVFFPNEIMDLSRAISLQHLCLSMTLLQSQQLLYIGVNCLHLSSISLFGCPAIFKGEDGMDLSGIEAIFSHCVNLRQLNIAGEHHHLYSCAPPEIDRVRDVFNKMSSLKSLAIPVCLLCESEVDSPSVRRRKRLMTPSPSAATPSKRSRVSRVPGKSSTEPEPSTSSSTATDAHRPALLRLAENNPDLEELEIIAVNFQSACHKNKFVNSRLQQFSPCVETRMVGNAELEPVKQFRKLRSLTLIGTPNLVCGQYFTTIAESCPQLESLSIGYLGGALYGNYFSNALTQMKNLTDLRIEQPHLYLNPTLFNGLSKCKSLQRLCIIAKHSAFNPGLILNFVEQCTRLVVVQLFSGATLTACKSLSSQIIKKYSKSRPSLSVCIHPLMHDELNHLTNNIPAKHLSELTRFHSKVASEPPDLKNKI